MGCGLGGIGARPVPAGNATAQPVLDFAFESADRGAVDQTFRHIIRPDRWGSQVRLRFANTFVTQPVVIDGVYVGLQGMAGNVVTGTNQRVTFGNGGSLTLDAGRSGFSDPVTLRFVPRAEKTLLTGPFAGGPSTLDRLDRDVLSLPGVSTIIWLEGINDLSAGQALMLSSAACATG